MAENKQKANGAKIYTIAATCFDDAEPTGTDTVETIAYTAPEKPLVLRGTKEVPRTGADLTKVNVVVGAGRGFAEEDELQIARDLCEKVGGELVAPVRSLRTSTAAEEPLHRRFWPSARS